MKKIIIISILLIIIIKGYGQSPVTQIIEDPGTRTWQGEQLTKAIEQITQAKNTVEGIRETAKFVQETKSQIEQLYYYQQKLRNDIEGIRGIKDMKWSDLLYCSGRAIGISTNKEDYIPNFNRKGDFYYSMNYSSMKNKTDREKLYCLIGPALEYLVSEESKRGYDLSTPEGVQEYQDALSGQRNYQRYNHLRLKEFNNKVKLSGAEYYRETADTNIYKAQEMAMVLTEPGKIEMTNAERITILNEANQLVNQSVEAKLKEAQLLEDASNETKEDEMLFFKNQFILEGLKASQVGYGNMSKIIDELNNSFVLKDGGIGSMFDYYISILFAVAVVIGAAKTTASMIFGKPSAFKNLGWFLAIVIFWYLFGTIKADLF